jgi:hypothetical protein
MDIFDQTGEIDLSQMMSSPNDFVGDPGVHTTQHPWIPAKNMPE